MTERVFVLGAGRAGLGLARALRAVGVEVVGVHGRRNPGGSDRVTVGAFPPSLANASVVLVTVRDEQLDDALNELAVAPLAPGAAVLHASGGSHPVALDTLRALGYPCGTFHPLLPLADPSRAARLLRGGWIGLDGDDRAVEAGNALATALGAHTLVIPPGEKGRYHAAAVFASNFPPVLLAVAERLLMDAGVPAEAARGAARTLFMASVENLRAGGQVDDVLTGPVARGDVETVRRHLHALRGDAAVRDLYRLLSGAAVRWRRDDGARNVALEAIAQLVADERPRHA